MFMVDPVFVGGEQCATPSAVLAGTSRSNHD
jgi:hypothetical protein